jgi:hypothetical protein
MKNTFNAIKLESWIAIFNKNNDNHGRIVQKYNIISALVENYFISNSQIEGYELARSKQNMNAHKIFGKKITI